MILFLTGPDDYRREQRKRYLIEEFQKKYSGYGVERFFISTKEGREKFHELVFSPSLFSTKRLAILHDVFESDDKSLLKDLKQALEDKTLWVFISEKDKVPAAFKFLTKEPVTFEPFDFLEGDGWKRFVVAEAKARELKLDPEALRLLLVSYKEDTWRLITELDRLHGLERVIVPNDIQISDRPKTLNLWSVLSELRGASLERRLYALEKIFESQEPAAKIFNIMAAQPAGMINRFADWDVAIKSGKLEYEEILLDFVLSK